MQTTNWWQEIARYEDGVLEHDEVVALFQALVDNGMVWQLQGHYGRTARRLIDSGEVSG
jgi:hypothetical protein